MVKLVSLWCEFSVLSAASALIVVVEVLRALRVFVVKR
jgi:hypothetical protein